MFYFRIRLHSIVKVTDRYIQLRVCSPEVMWSGECLDEYSESTTRSTSHYGWSPFDEDSNVLSSALSSFWLRTYLSERKKSGPVDELINVTPGKKFRRLENLSRPL